MFEFVWKPACDHKKITPNMIAGYCPDCGEYIQNHWYITRCKCCGVKQRTVIKNGRIVANVKFCKNCGSESFVVEELSCLDIVNVNYAAVKRQVRKDKRQSTIQAWVEHNICSTMKLIPTY